MQQRAVDVEHYTTTEAAAKLRMTPDGVLKRIKRGQLPGVHIGHRWLIPKATLDAMLQQLRRPKVHKAEAGAGGEPQPRCHRPRAPPKRSTHHDRRSPDDTTGDPPMTPHLALSPSAPSTLNLTLMTIVHLSHRRSRVGKGAHVLTRALR